MPFYKDASFWLSVITVVVAIVALFQSHKQIKISNKQHLFDRRLEKYIFLKDLVTLYSHAQSSLDAQTFCTTAICIPINELTNISELEKMALVIDNPMDNRNRKIFLEKLEKIRRLSEEVNFLWNGDEAKLVSKFVSLYHDLLKALYRQTTAIYDLNQQNDELIKAQGQPMPLEIYDKKAFTLMQNAHLIEITENIELKYQEISKAKTLDRLAKSIDLGEQKND